MRINKKSILIISALLVLMLAIILKTPKSEAREVESVFKTADGKIVKIIYDEKTSNKEIKTEDVVSDGNEDDEVYYGKIIKRNGTTERVYAISEDGSFITEVIEDGEK